MQVKKIIESTWRASNYWPDFFKYFSVIRESKYLQEVVIKWLIELGVIDNLSAEPEIS